MLINQSTQEQRNESTNKPIKPNQSINKEIANLTAC
jgi:hypothetical protein